MGFLHDQVLGLSFKGEEVGAGGGCMPVTSNKAIPEVEPGSIAFVRVNSRYAGFAYVKAAVAVAEGTCLALKLNHDDADVDAAQAITTAKLKGTGDFTANEYLGMAGWAHINAGGGLKHGAHAIMRNDANNLYTDENWNEALTTASDYVCHLLNAVVGADNDALATMGVAGVGIGTITNTYYGWIQISGVCRKVLSVGTTDAIVLGEGVQSDTAVGNCKGWTNGGTTAEDAHNSFGIALAADAEATSAGEGVPVLLTNCLKWWI